MESFWSTEEAAVIVVHRVDSTLEALGYVSTLDVRYASGLLKSRAGHIAQ
jgi:hypothetical protein